MQIGWIAMVTASMYYELQELTTRGVYDYLGSVWTYLELAHFLLSLGAIAVQLARVVLVDGFLDRLADLHYSQYVSFAVPRLLDQVCM